MNYKNFWTALEELTSPLFKTYLAVERLADNKLGYCFASNEDISKKLNKHEKSISRDINNLIKIGYLWVIHIKIGFKVIERRLYTTDQYELYLKDFHNKHNLIKTTYKKNNDKVIYFNEKNLKNTSNSFDECSSSKIVEGTILKNVTLNNTNLIKTKTTTTKINFLDKYIDTITKNNILKYKPNITEEEFLKIFNKCKIEVNKGFGKSLNGILVKAIQGLWNFQEKQSLTVDSKTLIEKYYLESIDYYKCFIDYISPEEVIERFRKNCKNLDSEIFNIYLAKINTYINQLKDVQI